MHCSSVALILPWRQPAPYRVDRSGKLPPCSPSDVQSIGLGHRPCAMPKQIVLAYFGGPFGPGKITKCLETRPLWTKKKGKWIKNVFFPKNDPRPFRMPVVVGIVGPWWPVLAPKKSQNALKLGGVGTKNGSNPRPLRMPKRVVCAYFDAIWACYGLPKCCQNGTWQAN